MKVTLYTTYYADKDTRRQSENKFCLQKNVECDDIHEIRVLCQGSANVGFLRSPKVVEANFGDRPRFSDFMAMINENAESDDISIIANTDIYFDESLSKLHHVNLDAIVYALTRWDLGEDGRIQFFGKAESQDAWIFKGKCPVHVGQFPIGQYGCDNRFAWQLKESGYRVWNPSLSINIYHYHCSQSRGYLQDKNYEKHTPKYTCITSLKLES